jgi:hypothetical protein
MGFLLAGILVSGKKPERITRRSRNPALSRGDFRLNLTGDSGT